MDVEEIANSTPSFIASKNLPVAASTPKVLRKCNKCQGKSKKIKKWKRKHDGLNKRFKKLKEKYTELKNTQVQLVSVCILNLLCTQVFLLTESDRMGTNNS